MTNPFEKSHQNTQKDDIQDEDDKDSNKNIDKFNQSEDLTPKS